MVSDEGSMHVSPNLPRSGYEYTVVDPYELGRSNGGYQPTTLDPITTLSFPAAENLPTTFSNPITEYLIAPIFVNPISDVNLPLSTAEGYGTPVEVVTVMMREGDEQFESSVPLLALPQPTYNNVPDKYTLTVNPDGSATVSGPKGGEYNSTGFYDDNGNLIYQSRSGEYVIFNGSKTTTKAPSDYSSIPIHHICTNKCNIGQNGKTAWTPKYQEFFEGAGLNIDKSVENLVKVPGHRGPHPEIYHQYVFGRLDEATNRLIPHTLEYENAFKSTLNKIKQEALIPGSKVNDWLTGK